MNLFENIFDKFTKQAQPMPSFGTPQAPRTASYVAPNIPITTAPKVSQGVRNGGFAPGYEGTVDTSQNIFNRVMTPVEQVGQSLFQNQVQGGQQLSDIAMQHSQDVIDRGYNQGYIDLGQKIKAKHPQYSDISDEELGRKIVAKYPQYQDIVDAGSGIMSNPISGTLASIESGLSKGIGTMFSGISNLGSAPLQETGTAGVTRFTKGALETGLGSAQLATSIMPTTLGAKALVAPTVNTLFSTDTAGKVLQPISQGIETGIGMGQEALGYNPESSVSKDIQNIGSTVGNLALFAGAQKGGAKGYDLAKPFVNKAVQKVSNIPNPITGAKNVITREIPVGIMERDLSLTPTERASIETINGKPAGAVALEYNLPKDKQAMADTLSVKADEAYNGITNDLKNIPTRTESVPAKEMLGIMLDEMGNSPILVRTMKPYMEKLQSMMEQPDYSLAEKNAIRRDFDRIVANKIFDSKGRVSGIEDKAIANIRERLSTELQNEAMQYGIDIKGKNDILRTSIALRDGVLRRLSQENKNNKIGLQDIGVGAILGAGDPLTTASVIFGKKVLEKSSPGIAQKLYNSNKTPYATSNLKRGVTISPRDTTNGLSITPDNVSTVRIPVKKPTVKPNSTTNAKQPRNIVKPSTKSDSDIPEGYFKNAFGEIVKNPSNKNGGFIKVPGGKPVEKTVKAIDKNAVKDAVGNWKPVDGKYTVSNIDISKTNAFPRAKYHREDYINTPSYKYWLKQAKKGADIPPVVVEKTPTGYNVVDGYHRLAAVEDAGIKDIKAIVLDTPILKGEKAKGVKQFTSFSDSEIEKILNTKPLSPQKTVKPKNLTEGKQSATIGDMETKKIIPIFRGQSHKGFTAFEGDGKQRFIPGMKGTSFSKDLQSANNYGDYIIEGYITKDSVLSKNDVSKDLLDSLKKKIAKLEYEDYTEGYGFEKIVSEIAEIAESKGKSAIDLTEFFPKSKIDDEIRVLNKKGLTIK